MQDKQIENINRRRIFLIDKEFRCSLNKDESAELNGLQIVFSKYMDKAHPLPFAELEAMETKVKNNE